MPLSAGFAPLPRESARDAVYDRIRDWILNGPLEPNETIRDGEIAKKLGVSRTPVREALLRLESDGLVVTASARWTKVAPLRLDQAPNLYRVVAALDGLAAEQATPNLDKHALSAMAEANEQLWKAKGPDGFQRTDYLFHSVYRLAAANPVTISVLDNVAFEIRRIERAYFQDPLVVDNSYRGHLAILDAFQAGDAAAASQAARANWLASIPRVSALAERAAKDEVTVVGSHDQAPVMSRAKRGEDRSMSGEP
jgi:DNA-binding GntR family transcriptional regulator